MTLISTRQANIMERINPSVTITLAFEYDMQREANYVILYNSPSPIYDNIVLSYRRLEGYAPDFKLLHTATTFNSSNTNSFEHCSADFSNNEYAMIHRIIDDFQKSLEKHGMSSKISEDTVYTIEGVGSLYVVTINVKKILSLKKANIMDKLYSKPSYTNPETSDRFWFKNNKFIEDPKKNPWYWGELHKVNGPAMEYESGTKYWYLNGKRHRTDGPAIEYHSGRKEWWLNGKPLTEKEFNAIPTDQRGSYGL